MNIHASIIAVTLLFAGAAGCRALPPASGPPDSLATTPEYLRLRWERAVGHYKEIPNGMSSRMVQRILSFPDKERPLYTLDDPKQLIGFVWFYLKEPRQRPEQSPAGIVVRFDLTWQVVDVETWGLDN